MDYYLIENINTGWKGSVTKEMYHKLINRPDHRDPRPADVAYEYQVRAMGEDARNRIKAYGVSAGRSFAERVDIVRHWAQTAADILNPGLPVANVRLRQSPRQKRRVT